MPLRKFRRTFKLAVMPSSWFSLAAVFLLALCAQAAVVIEPPPGWEDVTRQKRSQEVAAALKGPQSSSFSLTRIRFLPLDNRAGVLSFLTDVLNALNRRGGGFTQSSALLAATYDNGVTFQYIKATRDGRPRLVLGITDYGGDLMLGTLLSAVPDTILPSIIEGFRGASSDRRTAARGPALSSDGQLAFTLAPGLVARSLTESEKRQGFVLAIAAADAELMIVKVVETQSTRQSDHARKVRDTVLAGAGVARRSVSSIQTLKTPPGPDLIFVVAQVAGEGGPEFLAGYMPWAYWGYSVLAKGVDPADLARETFSALTLGPSALPKLVASTPAVPVPIRWEWLGRNPMIVGAAAAVLIGLLALWLRRR